MPFLFVDRKDGGATGGLGGVLMYAGSVVKFESWRDVSLKPIPPCLTLSRFGYESFCSQGPL